MNHNDTDITVVLDRSGSMESVRSDTIGGFNSFLNEQKSLPHNATFTLVQFDNRYEMVHDGISLHNVPPLNNKTFKPRGSTALLDAIGRTINRTGQRLRNMNEPDRPGKVVFVIITDGLENASREFNKHQINDMISLQRDTYSWEFIFLGANQDAIATASSLGVATGSALTYAANADGTQAAFASMSKNLASFRKGSAPQVAFNDEDRAKQKKAGA